MSHTEKSIRDRYFSNEIFRIGDIVEDIQTKEQMKILDRGSNYVTVTSGDTVTKKWLNDITDVVAPEPLLEKVSSDFELIDNGQIRLFGHDTRNFDQSLSETLLEQFSEFDDLYSKHQIVKCLDFAIQEDDQTVAYDLLDKVEKFSNKHSMEVPFIVEVMKNELERKRIVEILATIADVKVTKSLYDTSVSAIKALREKYQSRKQWEVLWPFIKLAQDAGLTGLSHNIPFVFGNTNDSTDNIKEDIMVATFEENVDLLADEITDEELLSAFDESDFIEGDDQIDETLSITSRVSLGRKMARHEPILAQKRDRALNRAANANVLLQRARKLAETILKQKMFHKSPDELTRQEKERFEDGATRRRALVAKLAMRLVPRVRALQNSRLHHTHSPVSHNLDAATRAIAKSGAS